MILFPAIDISEGKAVRLRQGHFEDVTVYRDDPLEAAKAWVDAGARYLHVVDLDGARAGEPRSLEHLERIASALDTPVQYGGGLRSLPAVRDALRAGASRIVLGTAAYTDIDLLDEVLAAYGDRVIVSGGIGTLDDLRAIASLRRVNIAGVIVGKALYEGRFTVAEGQEALD